MIFSTRAEPFLENQVDNHYTIIKLSNMTWWFSPEVIAAFEDAGMPMPNELKSFIFKVLSMKKVRDGEVELTMMGLGLRIQKDKFNISVNLLEDGEKAQEPQISP
jgi:hypothetical protein